jgi:ribosomal protein S18 acetylase RimI-like enzyme
MPVLLADLTSSDHQQAITDLLDMYCRDEFGDSRPLGEEVRSSLILGLVRHGGARVFLAYEGERPVGLALCFVGFSSFKAKPLLNIHDIAVRPEFRGQGVGRQLLAAVEDHARAAGCCKVTLEVRSDNARAQRAYRAAGFQSTQPETWFWSRALE